MIDETEITSSRLPLVNISCIPEKPLVWTLGVPRRNKGTTRHNEDLMKFIYSNGFITQYSYAESNRQKQTIVNELLGEIIKRGYIETYNPDQGQPNKRLNPEGLKSNMHLITRLRTLIANKASYSKRKNKKEDESDERLRNNQTSKRKLPDVPNVDNSSPEPSQVTKVDHIIPKPFESDIFDVDDHEFLSDDYVNMILNNYYPTFKYPPPSDDKKIILNIIFKRNSLFSFPIPKKFKMGTIDKEIAINEKNVIRMKNVKRSSATEKYTSHEMMDLCISLLKG